MQDEIRIFVRELESELKHLVPINQLDPVDIRRQQESGEGRYVAPVLSDHAIERQIPNEGANIPVRAFIPEGQIDGIYMHIHGGGWVIGGAHHSDKELEEIRDNCNAAVISVDYRLAPENKYPLAQDDCEAVALWIVEHASQEFGTDSIVIGGESAGAHLAATTMVRLRDKHGYTGFVGANMLYGVFDLSMTPSCRLWGDRWLVLSTPIMEWFINNYLSDGDDRTDPDISPIYAVLHDLPPALFTVGTADPLLDDTLFMHSRWFASGNVSTLNVYSGAPHGFEKHPTQLAEQVRRRISQFVKECF
jgi:acetyl esterase/lipase